MTMQQLLLHHDRDIRKIVRYHGDQYHLDYDDLLQELRLRLLRFPASYSEHEDGGFKAWINRITSNICIDIYRRSRNHKHHHFAVDVRTAVGVKSYIHADQYETRQRLARVYREIRAHWGTRWGLMIYLFAIGYKQEEVAKMMNTSVSVMKSRQHRIRLWLKTKFL